MKLIPSLLASLSATLTVAALIPRDSSFSVINCKARFTFAYATSEPSDKNWIGIYNHGRGPEDGVHVEGSLSWDYAPASTGEILVPAEGLKPGTYDAYFCKDDGWESLTEWIEVQVPLEFLPNGVVTLKNAKVGTEYKYNIGGFLGDVEDTEVAYQIEGPQWASISDDGTISGVPDASGTESITVTASAGNAMATLQVSVPVVASDEELVTRFNVMSFNLWHRGTMVKNHHTKQIRFLAAANLDILALQETDAATTESLATALGWNWYSGGDLGVLSRYPIVEEHADHGHGISVAVDLGGTRVNVWDVHLAYTPYGPYDFCFDNMTVDEVLNREESSGRGPQIRKTLSLMEDQISGSAPVILLGDFNAPSHLDYTRSTADAHCGAYDVDWPTSKVPVDAGLTDSLREYHPDPEAEPHNTWSPIFLENEGRKEPLDRIDFVYHGGDLEVLGADTLVQGKPKPMPDHEENEWTSDHKAVLVKYQFK